MSRRSAVVMLVVGVAASAVVQAQEDRSTPFYVGARLGVSHEDNLFRRPSGQAQTSDLVTTLSLLAGVDQPIGRQRVYLDGNVSRNQYQDEGQLDNTSYSLAAGVDWSTIERLSGNVNLAASERLAKFEPQFGTVERNLVQTRSLSATARLGVVTRLGLTAGVAYTELRYSLDDFAFNRQEFDQWSVSGGVDYRFSGLLTAGAALRHTEATYPNYFPNGNEDKVERDDLDLTAVWVPTGASTVRARVSFGLSSSDSNANGFDGVTTLVTWNWVPTGKLRFATTLIRDSGRNAGAPTDPFTGRPLDGDYDTGLSRVSNTLLVQANYALTAKVGLNARARYVDRDLRTIVAPGASPSSASDSTTAVGLGATWAVLRTVSLGCNASHERRSASGDPQLSSSYSANIYGCFAQVLLEL